ncbi:acetoacetate decarboxylase family protein [Acetobacterium malicum]|uniref:acetoacetate decarboxylase family protein n=1 Tax=Acetobacterium malicum TaxID=52692 RepID=UPI00041A864B|nr:acetoacetate decarboxylase family protein [Acetobacterium dehalogenans]
MTDYPAPWTLRGYGYILLYRFGTSFANQQAPEFLTDQAIPGFGSVMLVNYQTSDCGPYGELLVIPGKYQYHQEKKHTISKIYVSSQASVENGRKNWGIPKELAQFNFEPQSDKSEKVTVTNRNNGESSPIFEASFKTGPIPFPVSTRLLPFPLIQHWDNKAFRTTFSGTGTGRFATMTDLNINENFFPDLGRFKPLAIIKVDPFAITFPAAKINKLTR